MRLLFPRCTGERPLAPTGIGANARAARVFTGANVTPFRHANMGSTRATSTVCALCDVWTPSALEGHGLQWQAATLDKH